MEVRLKDRLQDQLHGRLHHAILDRRDAQGSRPAFWLRDISTTRTGANW